eukprot:CAMPEP_0198234848 /NCGR_PEP_ID=MMETSP1446-20131203/727_1 /TAXON_ID=1461542 ORGANISM="Unidentified sp, Strain CCMP2111" /NCGR_SAMPLE_ID=MMETSP1446 /ASSEMBLY_ACC=CAM_ASM_001112 /LENGTH=460 /DNA_ID=CAMNT_0043915673 /DNA_START=133 /DNA_END=1515 /DNA_ORIENTATION=+
MAATPSEGETTPLIDGDWKDTPEGEGPSSSKALRSSAFALCLAVAGSSVLPIPHAVYNTGIVLGFVSILVIALVNDYTGSIILDCACQTGRKSYEELAELAYGYRFRVFTQCCLITLLFGNLCGSLAAMGEAACVAVKTAHLPHNWEDMLTKDNARILLTILTLTVVFPLSMLTKMRHLEVFGEGGFFVVLMLIVITFVSALDAGFPAIRDGELGLFTFTHYAPEAFGVFGFAFYLQPLLLPLYQELPRGKKGKVIAKQALHLATFAFAVVVYVLIGVFAVARFGKDTKGNILENFKGRSMAVVDAIVTLYLAFSYPTIQFSLRCSLDKLVAGDNPSFSWVRHTTETAAVVGGTLIVALFFRKGSNIIFALTGSTAVCVVCYILPVLFHFRFKAEGSASREHVRRNLEEPFAGEEGILSKTLSGWRAQYVRFEHVVTPAVAVFVGIVASALSLYTSLSEM